MFDSSNLGNHLLDSKLMQAILSLAKLRQIISTMKDLAPATVCIHLISRLVALQLFRKRRTLLRLQLRRIELVKCL